MSEYIPSTNLICETYAVSGIRTRGDWTNADRKHFAVAQSMFLNWLVQERAQAAAQALRDAADALPDDTEGPNRVGTAWWPERQRDAYSIAIEEAQEALRERASEQEATP